VVARRARFAAALALALALASTTACSGKPHTEEAARVPAAGDAAAPADAVAGDAPASDAPRRAVAAAGDAGARATGDLQVRVEWPDVPVAARRSPGRTPCGTPRAPSVMPTTTWGIPDALVVVDGAPPPGASPAAQVTLADCALTPRIAAGASLAITSAVDRPARLVLRKRGPLDHLVAGEPLPVLLPIAGHTVTAALDPGAIYSLETDAPEPELGFIAALPDARVTDATGHVLVRDLAPGAHAITAWLPPRAGQPARTGRGTATVNVGELTEVTIRLAP
jgi:hypothetical protein